MRDEVLEELRKLNLTYKDESQLERSMARLLSECIIRCDGLIVIRWSDLLIDSPLIQGFLPDRCDA